MVLFFGHVILSLAFKMDIDCCRCDAVEATFFCCLWLVRKTIATVSEKLTWVARKFLAQQGKKKNYLASTLENLNCFIF